jgi:hypothetical protein
MKPIIINNSKIPVFLSHFSPIDIWAITLWPFIICRGEMSEGTVNHESIHIEQYNDLFVLGFLFLYYWDYMHGFIKYRNDISGVSPHGRPYDSVGSKAYYRIRAEQEAYEFDGDFDYLERRKKYEWLKKYKV